MTLIRKLKSGYREDVFYINRRVRLEVTERHPDCCPSMRSSTLKYRVRKITLFSLLVYVLRLPFKGITNTPYTYEWRYGHSGTDEIGGSVFISLTPSIVASLIKEVRRSHGARRTYLQELKRGDRGALSKYCATLSPHFTP